MGSVLKGNTGYLTCIVSNKEWSCEDFLNAPLKILDRFHLKYSPRAHGKFQTGASTKADRYDKILLNRSIES
uniref:Uncharacterized protein n=1 Tax=Pararge aegeria TaxID=116150 RepID=S4PCC4_9NEOP